MASSIIKFVVERLGLQAPGNTDEAFHFPLDSAVDSERNSYWPLKQLYKAFEDDKWPGRDAAFTKLLHKLLSIFIEHSFEKYLDIYCSLKNTQGMSGDEITKLDNKLEKIRRSNPSQYKFNSGSRLGRRQLMLYVAATFMSPELVRGSMVLSPSCIATKNIEHLNVPALLDSIWGCKLFGSGWAYKHCIVKIVDAYNDMWYTAPSHKTTPLKGLLSAMKVFLQQIDDRLLPNKSHFHDQLRDIEAVETQRALDMTDADLKNRLDALVQADSDLKEKQEVLVKTDADLKEKQDVLVKKDADLKEKQDAVVQEVSNLKETQRALKQADIKLKEKQTFLEITLKDIQKHFSHLDEIYDSKSNSEIATSVASIQADLQTPTYHNWIKGTLTLKYLSEGARCFVLMMFEKFQRQALPENGSHFDNGASIQRLSVDGVKWKDNSWVYLTDKSHCEVCAALFDGVKRRHRRFKTKAVFNNCRKVQVPGAWGIAKLFMPPHCVDVRTPGDLDAHGLFTTIQNCLMFNKFTVTEKIIEMRNMMMHSPDLTMSDGQLYKLYECAKKFADEAIAQIIAAEEVKQKLISSKTVIEETYECKIDIKALIKLGGEAIQHEREELVKKPADSESESQIRDKQTQIQTKLECYKLVENTPLSNLQQTNTDVAEDMELTLNKIKETILVLEKTERELEAQIQMTKMKEVPSFDD